MIGRSNVRVGYWPVTIRRRDPYDLFTPNEGDLRCAITRRCCDKFTVALGRRTWNQLVNRTVCEYVTAKRCYLIQRTFLNLDNVKLNRVTARIRNS